MNPMVLFLFLRSLYRTAFSKDPALVEERKRLEDWYTHDIRGAFIEGYEGEKETEWIRMDIPQGKFYRLYRWLAYLCFVSFFPLVALLASPARADNVPWILRIPLPAGVFFLYNMWRQRAHRATVKVWKGTREPVANWR